MKLKFSWHRFIYPRADLEVLDHKLCSEGVPGEITKWLEWRYSGRHTQLLFHDYTTNTFTPPGGLDQGDPFAVVQYLFYNSRLLKVIKEKAEELGLLFMDDATLVVWGPSFTATHQKLEHLMNDPGGVLDWARAHNCSFGLEKFQLADYTRKRAPHPTQRKKTIPVRGNPIIVGGQVIPVREGIKLLGLFLDAELRYKEQSAIAIQKGQTWLSQFRRLSRTTGGVASQHIRDWYTAILMSRMLYGADIFLSPQRHPGPRTNARLSTRKPQRAVISRLASIQRQASLIITGALPSTPSDLLDIHADLLPMSFAVDKFSYQGSFPK